jgi:NADH:ubiquinone oxidoreductase subunit 6 (subunit J)
MKVILSIAVYLGLVFVLGFVMAMTARRDDAELEKSEDF